VCSLIYLSVALMNVTSLIVSLDCLATLVTASYVIAAIVTLVPFVGSPIH